mmetsp:Transcript_84982/g.243888  ORF Transcript_84982/g.243888 Transcript_84982/m.243888 type:complete len:216 (-) Transcript_84982:850-1497(-)
MQRCHKVHVQPLAYESHTLSSTMAVVHAEKGTVPPVRGRKVLKQDLLILHGGTKALLGVHGRVEAQDLELQAPDPQRVVRLEPVALVRAKSDPSFLGRLGRALAQVDVVPAEGVTDPEPLAVLPAVHGDDTDCRLLGNARRNPGWAHECRIELVLGLAPRRQCDGASLPSNGGLWRRLHRSRHLWIRPGDELERVPGIPAGRPHAVKFPQGARQG